MEEPVLGKLLYVVIYKFRAHLVDIIALTAHFLCVIKLKAADILHNKYIFCCQLIIHPRAIDILHALVIAADGADILGLTEKVHLFLRNEPHLVDAVAQVHYIVDALELHYIQRFFDEPDIPLHLVIYIGALDLHSDMRAVEQYRLVHLRNGRCAQGDGQNALEHGVPRLAILLADYLPYLGGDERGGVRSEALELLAILHGYDLGVHRQKLA